VTPDNLRHLLDYNYWARDRVLDAAATLTPEQFTRDLGNSFKSVRDTLAHIYFAELVWYKRWHGESVTSMPSADMFGDVASIRDVWSDHERKMRSFLDGLDEVAIDRVHEYRLMNGQPGTSVFWQMLQHLVNHGSYHRGQVTTLLRQLGAAPAKSMDLIAYYRERAGTARS
jgi:uncharacterized damage-inducible protein DinB